MFKTGLTALAGALLFTTIGSAAQADTLDYQLDAINGSWSWGNTQWNNVDGQGYVNNGADVGAVNALFNGPYVYSAPRTVPGNAIYSWDESPFGSGAKSLVFSSLDGTVTLNTLSILTSRSYSSLTSIGLDYTTNGGASWINVLSSTTGALGWMDVGTAGTATQTVVLNFGGVTGNGFRFTTAGNQINIHTLALDGLAGGVPEPATWALMILGMGAVGGAMRHRRKNAATVRFA